jgi:general secretion pathway protein A
LKQRVALRCSLAPLNTGQVAAYIAGRVSFAGGDPVALFTRDAVAAIAMRSRGIPRLVSVICDNALLNGFALGLRPVDGALIHEVCADLDLLPSAPLSSSVPATSDPAAARQRPALHAAGNVRSFFSHVIGTAERAFRPTARVVHR